MGSQAIPFCTHSFSISFISVIFLQFSLVLSAKIEKKLQKQIKIQRNNQFERNSHIIERFCFEFFILELVNL